MRIEVTYLDGKTETYDGAWWVNMNRTMEIRKEASAPPMIYIPLTSIKYYKVIP